MQTYTQPSPEPHAPPSQQPAPPTTAPATTTTAPMTQLPVTGPSDDLAMGLVAFGLPVLLVGAVLIVVARRWRARTD